MGNTSVWLLILSLGIIATAETENPKIIRVVASYETEPKASNFEVHLDTVVPDIGDEDKIYLSFIVNHGSDPANISNKGEAANPKEKILQFTIDLDIYDEVELVLDLHKNGGPPSLGISKAKVLMKNLDGSSIKLTNDTENILRVFCDYTNENIHICPNDDPTKCVALPSQVSYHPFSNGDQYLCTKLDTVPYCFHKLAPENHALGSGPVELSFVRIVYPDELTNTPQGNLEVALKVDAGNPYDIVFSSDAGTTYTACIEVTNKCNEYKLPVHQLTPSTHDVFVVQYAAGTPETITASSIIHTVEDYTLDGTKIDTIFEMRWSDHPEHGKYTVTLTDENGDDVNTDTTKPDAEFNVATVQCDADQQCFAYFFLKTDKGKKVIVKPHADAPKGNLVRNMNDAPNYIGEVLSAQYPPPSSVKDVTIGPSIRHITASWGSDGRSATVTTCLHHDPGRNASTHDLVLLDEAGRARRVSMDAPHLHDLCFPPVLLEEGGFAVGGEVRVLVLRRGGGGHVEAAHHVKTFFNRPETERVGDEATRLCWTNLYNEPSILNHPASSLNHQPTSLNCNQCCVNVKDDEKRTVQVSSMVAPEVWLTTVYQVRDLSVTVTGIEIVKRAGDTFAVDDQFSVTYDGVAPGEAVQSVHLTVIGETTVIEEVDYLGDPAGTATSATFTINQPMLDLTGPVTWMIKITTTKTSLYGEISFNMPGLDTLSGFPKCQSYDVVGTDSTLLRTECSVNPAPDDIKIESGVIKRTSNPEGTVTYHLFEQTIKGKQVKLCRNVEANINEATPATQLPMCTPLQATTQVDAVNIINSASLDYETGFTVSLEGKDPSELVIYSVEGSDMKYCTGATCKNDAFTKSTQTYNIVAVHVESEVKSSSQTQLTDMNIELHPVTDTILEYSFTHLPKKYDNQAKAISTAMNAENEKTVKITCTSDECFGYFLELGADKYKVSIKYYESENLSNMNEVVSETFDFPSPSKGSGHGKLH